MTSKEQAGYNAKFQEIMAPMAIEMAAHDPRIQDVAVEFSTNGGHYDPKKAYEILREYWLHAWEIDNILPLAVHEHDDLTWHETVSRAAQDPMVRSVIGWLLDTGIDDEMLVQDYYDAMEQHLVETYGLPPELSESVFNQCENTLREDEVNHGEA